MSWLKKMAEEWKALDWVKMLRRAFEVTNDVSPVGKFSQWSEPYMGRVSFMNEDETWKITVNMGMNLLGTYEAHIIIDYRYGGVKGFTLEGETVEYKMFVYNAVIKSYEIIRKMLQDENEDGFDSDDEPDGPLIPHSPKVLAPVAQNTDNIKIAFPAMDSPIPAVSPQEAHDFCWGRWFHGTSPEIISDILEKGFSWEEGEARSGQTIHGYEAVPYSGTGCIPPVHHLGYGIYLTSVKNIAKDYGYGSMRNVIELTVLKNAKIETINWGSPNTMMKWWKNMGYDCELAKIDRTAATKQLTDNLSSQFDAVWYKGKGLYKLLDGDQLCVYNPSILRRIDKSLASPGEIGSKVVKVDSWRESNIPTGMKGTVVDRREIGEQFKDYHNNEPEFLTIKWQKGGTDYNVYRSEVEFL